MAEEEEPAMGGERGDRDCVEGAGDPMREIEESLSRTCHAHICREKKTQGMDAPENINNSPAATSFQPARSIKVIGGKYSQYMQSGNEKITHHTVPLRQTLDPL